MDLPTIITQAKRSPQSVEEAIRVWLEGKFSLGIKKLSVLQSAVSLNSVNGRIDTVDERTLFFKLHAEQNEEALSEYYRVNVLKDAGLPVIDPLLQSSAPGEQVLIYPWIDAPTSYTLWLSVDQGERTKLPILLGAERELSDRCLDVARRTLSIAGTEDVRNESVWMLFSRRLVQDDTLMTPRLDKFYAGTSVALPDGSSMSFEELAAKQWIINGRRYRQTLAEIIAEAKAIVSPNARQSWPVVTAHGDEHNGNKFMIDGSLVFFDPAFASTGIPALLAFVKTTFHDTFAHPFWLYEPERAMPALMLRCSVTEDSISLEHNWDLETIAPARAELLRVKMKRLWEPLIALLHERNLLDDNSFRFVKCALACCPLLVDNLIGPKYTPALKILGLGRCVEMGTTAPGNLIDDVLQNIGLSPAR